MRIWATRDSSVSWTKPYDIGNQLEAGQFVYNAGAVTGGVLQGSCHLKSDHCELGMSEASEEARPPSWLPPPPQYQLQDFESLFPPQVRAPPATKPCSLRFSRFVT